MYICGCIVVAMLWRCVRDDDIDACGCAVCGHVMWLCYVLVWCGVVRCCGDLYSCCAVVIWLLRCSDVAMVIGKCYLW